MEHSEHSLTLVAEILKLALESISLLCILLGLLKTGQFLFNEGRRLQKTPSSLALIRLNFGRWLSLALEFQLGADIANTTVTPSFMALGKLGAIALIRTFLNYFLAKELAQEASTSRSEQTV